MLQSYHSGKLEQKDCKFRSSPDALVTLLCSDINADAWIVKEGLFGSGYRGLSPCVSGCFQGSHGRVGICGKKAAQPVASRKQRGGAAGDKNDSHCSPIWWPPFFNELHPPHCIQPKLTKDSPTDEHSTSVIQSPRQSPSSGYRRLLRSILDPNLGNLGGPCLQIKISQ